MPLDFGLWTLDFGLWTLLYPSAEKGRGYPLSLLYTNCSCRDFFSVFFSFFSLGFDIYICARGGGATMGLNSSNHKNNIPKSAGPLTLTRLHDDLVLFVFSEPGNGMI